MNQNPIDTTKSWISDFVIRHNLCPFARFPYEADQIEYFEVTGELVISEYLEHIVRYLIVLDKSLIYKTGFIIFPEADISFEDLLTMKDLAISIVASTQLKDKYQLVPFHPDYRFSRIPEDSPLHKINQSPYPMLHILDEEELDVAIDKYGDTSEIIEDNIKTMKKLFG